jgi:hypothetical protein
MDIDCDGAQATPNDDGRCGSSTDTQSITSFQSTVASYGAPGRDLDANLHTYVVLGNEASRGGWKTFDPREVGVEPLSIVAVVCGDRLVYGVWGDTNGDDGDHPMVGEASIALATACFGGDVSGNNGHDEADVLYIAFAGEDAVPGQRGANWSATDWQTFEGSLEEQGNRLVQRLTDSGASDTGGTHSLQAYRLLSVPLFVGTAMAFI